MKPNDAGKLAVLAGATTDAGIPAQLFTSSEARWIGIAVKGEPEQARVMVVSVPYAVRARDAERIGGRPAGDFVRVDELERKFRELIVEDRTAPFRQQPAQGAPSVNSQKINAPPKSDVTALSAAGSFQHQAATGYTAGVFGSTNSTNPGSDTSGVSGVLGEVIPTSPGGFSAGVRGLNFGTSNLGVGVVGVQNGYGYGVYGSTPSGVGVFATSGGIGLHTEHTGALAGPALELFNGGILVNGTDRAAFTCSEAPVSIPHAGPGAQFGVPIDNPFTNGKSNAIVYVTHWGHDDGSYFVDFDPKEVFAAYVPAMSKWVIFHSDGTTPPVGASYQVLVINQF